MLLENVGVILILGKRRESVLALDAQDLNTDQYQKMKDLFINEALYCF